ncbi:MAG: spore coat protein U domain-containing protein [Deltaproteobacteria bacterium]|nr:spore coat protein U domain-containing protein [Deltaproteobacteria bacterium]
MHICHRFQPRLIFKQARQKTNGWFKRRTPLIAFVFGVFLLFAASNTALAIKCNIRGTVGINFGTYDVFNATPTDSTGSITYRCRQVNGDPVLITLSRGSATSYNPRQMQSGAYVQQYNLYLDAAHSNIWGDGTEGTTYYQTIPPKNSNVTVTIYGRIPPGQDIPAGNYLDTIVATVQW